MENALTAASTGVEDAHPTEAEDASAGEFNVEDAIASLEEFASADADAKEDDADASSEEFVADGVECADCGHLGSAHAGEENIGACSMENCSCEGFARKGEAADTAAAVDVEEAAIETAPVVPVAVVTAGNSTSNISASQPFTLTLKDLTFVDTSGTLHTMSAGTANPFAVADVPVQIAEPEKTGGSGMRWTATLAPEGHATDDGRIFAPGSITWRELPLTLMGMVETAEGHDGAQVCGRIDEVWRDESTGQIMGAGEFDTGEFGMDIARLVGSGTLRGVSVDIAVAEMEILPRDEVVDEEGNWIGGDISTRPAGEEVDPMDALFGDNVVFVVVKGIIGAATVCPFPAFAGASIEVASSLVAAASPPNLWTVNQQAGWRCVLSGEVTEAVFKREDIEAALDTDLQPLFPEGFVPEVLTASAAGVAPVTPPVEWFDDPKLDELTPLTIDDDGRVFGHVAPWGVCHIGIPGVCTTAPQTETHYAYYMTKEVVAEDGSRLAVGTITMDTDHAGRDAGRAFAAAHYDNTGTAAADVVVGEDEFGIWMAGAIRGDLDEHKLRALRGASVSGDWREVNGNLELVGVLACNVAGFPIPRMKAALVASGETMKVMSLIAAGVIGRADTDKGALTRSEMRELELLRDQASGAYHELAAMVKEVSA